LIVDQYDINKMQLSLILGWGETILTMYLDGEIPSKSHSEKLKMVKNDYNYMK